MSYQVQKMEAKRGYKKWFINGKQVVDSFMSWQVSSLKCRCFRDTEQIKMVLGILTDNNREYEIDK